MPEKTMEIQLFSEDGQKVSAEEIKYKPRLVLGLDVGIASVGYALLDFVEEKIIALGSHLFEVGENPKDGASLAEPRRTKRGQRRRLDRRSRRLSGLRNMFLEAGLIEGKKLASHTLSGLAAPWELRVAALERKLSGEELARCLFHLAKRRGFKESLKDAANLRNDDESGPKKQNGKKENKSKADGESAVKKRDKDKDEEQKMLGGIKNLKADLEKSGLHTVGQFLLNKAREENGARLRNQAGDYQHTITRDMAEEEARTIIEKQRGFGGDKILSKEFEEAYIKLAFAQRPLKSVHHLVGECRFEKGQKRAAKATHSAELFILWSRLNNVRIRMEASADERELTAEEKRAVLTKAYQTKSGVTFTALREIVQKISPGGDDIFFNLVNYNTAFKKTKDTEQVAQELAKITSADKSKKKIRAEAEKANFVKIPAWHEIKGAVGETTEAWARIKYDRAILDEIGKIITRYPNDEEVLEKLTPILKPLGFSDETLNKMAGLEGSAFKRYIDLSLTAVGNILPHMENGERYDQAASRVYGSHSQAEKKKMKLLPPIKELRNPVVRRAAAQTRKLINAIIMRYGIPDRIHIEVARDLAKNHDERVKYKNEQNDYLAYLDDMKKHAAELFGCAESELKYQDRLLKYRLWKEQNGLCLYSGQAIHPNQLKDSTAVQIDHALPYSLTYDDSYKNKALVLASQNQNKGTKTPYEFLEPKGQWNDFQGRLWHLKSIPTSKKKHLSIQHLTDEVLNKFKARNLVDTGYIARTLKNHIESSLAQNPGTPPKWVQTRPGPLTALLRQRWGLVKDRNESPRHHAQDAAVVAASTEWMVQQAASWRREPEKAKRTYCPKPWANFRDDLLEAMKSEDNPTKKLFVSRRPERKFSGALHEDTIKSCRISEDGSSKIIKRIPLAKLKLEDVEKLIDKDRRNKKLYEALKERLKEYNGVAKTAFADDKPFCQPAQEGCGPRISSVKIETTDKPGVSYEKWRSATHGAARYGVADRGDMLRVDVFEKKGQFFLVPIYACDLSAGILPDSYTTPGKERSAWEKIDESFSFRFSLYKNDYVVLTSGKGAVTAGYYIKTGISTASVSVAGPDYVNSLEAKNCGVKTLKSFQKYAVNIFGELSEIKSETRLNLPDLSKKSKRSSGGSHGMANRSGGKSGQTEPEP